MVRHKPARKKSSNASRTAGRFSSTDWTPAPNNAIQLAALQWYSLTVGRLAIEIYATRPDRYAELTELLRKQVKELADFNKHAGEVADGCPDGYIMCRDGLCSPMCEGENL